MQPGGTTEVLSTSLQWLQQMTPLRSMAELGQHNHSYCAQGGSVLPKRSFSCRNLGQTAGGKGQSVPRRTKAK